MAAPDFPATPTVGQTYTAPSGLVYTWDGAVWSTTSAPQNAYWSDTGTALTPTDATKNVAVPGPATAANVILGSGTAKGRVTYILTQDMAALQYNVSWNGSAWVRDDATKGAWMAQIALSTNKAEWDYWSAAGVLTSVMNVDYTGNLTIANQTAVKSAGTTWANPSDPRLKDDIAPYGRGLAEIVRLEPISYRLKAQPDAPPSYGFDAAKVRTVFPECVATTRMKLDPADEEETDDVLVFDMHPILVALVNAVKEFAAKVEGLAPAPIHA